MVLIGYVTNLLASAEIDGNTAIARWMRDITFEDDGFAFLRHSAEGGKAVIDRPCNRDAVESKKGFRLRGSSKADTGSRDGGGSTE